MPGERVMDRGKGGEAHAMRRHERGRASMRQTETRAEVRVHTRVRNGGEPVEGRAARERGTRTREEDRGG